MVGAAPKQIIARVESEYRQIDIQASALRLEIQAQMPPGRDISPRLPIAHGAGTYTKPFTECGRSTKGGHEFVDRCDALIHTHNIHAS